MATQAAIVSTKKVPQPRNGLWPFWRKFVRVRAAALALLILVIIVLSGALAPLLAPFPQNQQNIMARLKPPLYEGTEGLHLLGTDALGRDILGRLLWGSRVSLLVGAASVLVAGTLGVTLGLVAGYFGGSVDAAIMRWTDIQLALPFLIMALAVVAVLGSGLWNVIIVLGVTGWVQYARIVRGEVLSVREREFVLGAYASGVPTRRILFYHILPNVTASIIVIASLQVARMILMEASLSFLGLGVPVEIPTWGRMVADGRDYLSIAPWVATLPGLAIFTTVLCINICGDRLRDMLDPTLRHQKEG
ncbi:MAG: ABC transporter permease [Ardenticatenaceae bacterium]|nr:ABC transporter permease [Ardenticatenaceae bacterium]